MGKQRATRVDADDFNETAGMHISKAAAKRIMKQQTAQKKASDALLLAHF